MTRARRLLPLAALASLAASLSGCAQTAGYAGLGMQAIAQDIQWRLRPNPSQWRLETPPSGERQHPLPSPAPAGALAYSETSVCWLNAPPDPDEQRNPCHAPGAIRAERLHSQPAFPARYLLITRSERRALGYVSLARYSISAPSRANALFEPAVLLQGQPLALSRLSVVVSSDEGPEFPRELFNAERERLRSEIPPAPYALLFYEPANAKAPAHTHWANSEYHYPLLSPRLLSMSPLRFPAPAAAQP